MGITIYSSQACVPCQYLRKYLDDKGITYSKHLVDEDEQAYEKMLELNGGKSTVPTVILGDKVMVGFNKKIVDEYILSKSFINSWQKRFINV